MLINLLGDFGTGVVVQSLSYVQNFVTPWAADARLPCPLPLPGVCWEGWVLQKYAFKLWCWRRLLRVLLTARRSNQSILKKINPEYSLEGLILKLKLQYFGHLMDSLEKTLMLGDTKAGGEESHRWLDGIIDSMETTLSKLWETAKDREPRRAAVHGVAKSHTQHINSSDLAAEQLWSDSIGINSKLLIGLDSQKLSRLVTKQLETKDTR